MRFAIYDRFDRYVGDADPISATWEGTLSGIDELNIKSFKEIERGCQVVWMDSTNSWHESTVDEVTTSHRGGKPITTAVCINSIRETLNDFIDDIRPADVSAEVMLNRAMDASGTRWELGPTDVEGLYSDTFYHTSLREAITDIIDDTGGELETAITVGTTGVTARYVGIRKKRGSSTNLRITYGRNMAGIDRKEGSYEGKSALYGYGRGVETETGGYGRRLKLTEVNPTGLDYIADNSLRQLYGRPAKNGTTAHSFGTAIYEKCTDPQELYDLTNEALHSQVPPVTYTCDLSEISVLRGCALGDTVTVIDRSFPTELRLSGRVTRIKVDLMTDSTEGTIEIGTESRTLADIIAEQNEKLDADTANQEVVEDNWNDVDPDHFYLYHAENGDPLAITNEATVFTMKFATVEDTRVALNTTVEHEMNLDGDLIARIYVDTELMKTAEIYEPRGKNILSFMWSHEFAKDIYFDLVLTLETKYVQSQIRENDADNKTLWNRSRAGSLVTWEEVEDTETWQSVTERTWEMWASGTAKKGTWASVMDDSEYSWTVVEPVTTIPTAAIGTSQAQGLLFGRGLAAIESWDGSVSIYDTIPLFSLKQDGLTVGFRDDVEASTQEPTVEGIAEAFGLSLVAVGLPVGFTDSVAMGEDAEMLYASDTEYDNTKVTASGSWWSSSTDTRVTGKEMGRDITITGLDHMAVSASADVRWSASFDGETWVAWDGSEWSEGTMDTSTLNGITEWPSHVLRVRFDMEAGSQVGPVTFYWERS